MKWFFFLAIMVSIFACTDNKNSGLKRWQISAETANKMKNYLKGCVTGCNDSTRIINYNKKVYDSIQAACKGCTITAIPARYKDQEDEARYCKLRGFSGDSCKVSGYKTIIYMVQGKSTSGSLTQMEYYDIVTICPPPRECGSSDTLQGP